MIGIKGMKMPKNCQDCKFFLTGEYSCDYTGFIVADKNEISETCPLVDLGSEDMSWEELKSKIIREILGKKSIFGYGIIGVTNNTICLFDESRNSFNCIPYLAFLDDGTVLNYQNIKIGKMKPYQMWQLINTLIGDNTGVVNEQRQTYV